MGCSDSKPEQAEDDQFVVSRPFLAAGPALRTLEWPTATTVLGFTVTAENTGLGREGAFATSLGAARLRCAVQQADGQRHAYLP